MSERSAVQTFGGVVEFDTYEPGELVEADHVCRTCWAIVQDRMQHATWHGDLEEAMREEPWVEIGKPIDPGQISDGFHTFDDLYRHRTALFALICRLRCDLSWRSREHHQDDDPMYPGFFIAGLSSLDGRFQDRISYHCKDDTWDWFEGVPELKRALPWDGHTPDGAVERLNRWFRS